MTMKMLSRDGGTWIRSASLVIFSVMSARLVGLGLLAATTAVVVVLVVVEWKWALQMMPTHPANRATSNCQQLETTLERPD